MIARQLARNLRSVGITGSSSADLAANVNDWLRDAGEKVVENIVALPGASFSVLIFYSE